MRLRPGDVVHGKYRLVRPLGDGGMGTIFEARHEVLGTTVALKFLHPELARRPGLVARFQQEARVSATLRSPHIVQVMDMEQGGQGVFLVMELLVGETLQAIIDRRRRLEQLVALDVALQMLAGLEVAHRAGVVHRDLKPDNVFLVTTPEGIIVKLLDFGIAKLKAAPEFQRGLTRPGVVMGTPEYMAPEQAFSADAVDPRADLYALGVLLFEMLSGQRPVGGDDARSIALQVTRGHVTPLQSLDPSLPAGLVAVVHRAMSPNPSHRYASAAEMRRALLPFAHALSPAARRSIPDLAAAEAAWTPSAALRSHFGNTNVPAPSIVYGELMPPAGRPSDPHSSRESAALLPPAPSFGGPANGSGPPSNGYGPMANGADPSTARGWPPGGGGDPGAARGCPPGNGAESSTARGWPPGNGAELASSRAWGPGNGAEPSTARGWPPAPNSSRGTAPHSQALALASGGQSAILGAGISPALSFPMSNTQPPPGPPPPPRPDATAPHAPMPQAFSGSSYGQNPNAAGPNHSYGANPHGGAPGWGGSQGPPGHDPNGGPGATALAPVYGQGQGQAPGQTALGHVHQGGAGPGATAPAPAYGMGASHGAGYSAGPSQLGYGSPPNNYGGAYPGGSSHIPSPAGWTQPPTRPRRRSSSASLWVVALLATLVGGGVVTALTVMDSSDDKPPSYATPPPTASLAPTGATAAPPGPALPPTVPTLTAAPPTATPPTATAGRPPTTPTTPRPPGTAPPIGAGGAGPTPGAGGASPAPPATNPGTLPFPTGLPSSFPTALPTALPSSLPQFPIPLPPFPGFPQAPSGQQ